MFLIIRIILILSTFSLIIILRYLLFMIYFVLVILIKTVLFRGRFFSLLIYFAVNNSLRVLSKYAIYDLLVDHWYILGPNTSFSILKLSVSLVFFNFITHLLRSFLKFLLRVCFESIYKVSFVYLIHV